MKIDYGTSIQGIGINLSRRFYRTLIEPLFQEHFADVPYAACRIGLGSEVLGFDTEMSADHDYGPCVQIFLSNAGFEATADKMILLLDQLLPDTFEGWAVRFSTNSRPPGINNRRPGMLGSSHGVELYTVKAWSNRFLGRQFTTELSPQDWLSYSEQLFLTVTAGAVFRDDIGELTALRNRLAYFPRDVWLYKLLAQWGRISEERAYVGRAGEAGDEIGSRVIGARMVGNLMRLAMLVERHYAPYPKWFGTAFSKLTCAPELSPILMKVLAAQNWQERERELLQACQFMAELQLLKQVPGATVPVLGTLHNRPFQFVDSLKIMDSLRGAIEDDYLKHLLDFGGADQFIASNFVLAVPKFTHAATTALLDTTI